MSDGQWIIQRCMQQWKKLTEVRIPELVYEDFPTPEGVMTRGQMVEVLERVGLEHPDDEFRGHRVA